MHESLKVYLKDRFVGWLSQESTGDVFSFKYDDAYLAGAGAQDKLIARIRDGHVILPNAVNAHHQAFGGWL